MDLTDLMAQAQALGDKAKADAAVKRAELAQQLQEQLEETLGTAAPVKAEEAAKAPPAWSDVLARADGSADQLTLDALALALPATPDAAAPDPPGPGAHRAGAEKQGPPCIPCSGGARAALAARCGGAAGPPGAGLGGSRRATDRARPGRGGPARRGAGGAGPDRLPAGIRRPAWRRPAWLHAAERRAGAGAAGRRAAGRRHAGRRSLSRAMPPVPAWRRPACAACVRRAPNGSTPTAQART